MRRGLEAKSVKSAQRVLEVLEYFDRDRSEVTVMDISRSLQYPQSSTSELLSSLTNLGYLCHDRARRTYRPTARVAAIGTHVGGSHFQRGVVADMIEDLNTETGATCAVTMIQRGTLHFVDIVGAGKPKNHVAPASVLESSLGQVLLASYDDAQVRGLIHRSNAENVDREPIRAADYLAYLREVRVRGFAIADAAPSFEGRMVSIALPANGIDALSVGIELASDADGDEERAVLAALRRAISCHLAPPVTDPSPRPTLAHAS